MLTSLFVRVKAIISYLMFSVVTSFSYDMSPVP
jgi:hypothetical protein